MSATWRPVTWNSNKFVYDAILIVAVVCYVTIFIELAPAWTGDARAIDAAVIRMRAFGTCAFLMLSAILCIGPLARLDRRWLPLLYNRRHFGVLTCIVALLHASHVLGWYFAFSPVDPFVAVLSSNTSFARFAGFPFELLGVAALFALVMLAATSHDFWLAFLGPPVWKAIHMSVYVAYAAVVGHVALGSMLASGNATLALMVGLSVVVVTTLHVVAAQKDIAESWPQAAPVEGWIPVGIPDEFVEGHGKVVEMVGGERVAIFRHLGKLSAVANACAHQNGPLGEGRVLDGCITCPWHGFQYRLEDGCAPAPFTEKLATYKLKLVAGCVLLDPCANPPGTWVDPLVINVEVA